MHNIVVQDSTFVLVLLFVKKGAALFTGELVVIRTKYSHLWQGAILVRIPGRFLSISSVLITMVLRKIASGVLVLPPPLKLNRELYCI